jgi:L-amino acid N-acyltransferase YncA
MDSTQNGIAPAAFLQGDLLQVIGSDNVEYAVRPYEWSLARAEEYFPQFVRIGIFSDDVPKTIDGFLRYVVAAGTVWFETVEVATGKHVGFLYISDLLPSWTEPRYISATWHAVVWDSKAAPRREVARAFIEQIFRLLKLHRLCVSIPLKFGGAIRNAKRLGFKEDGTVRSVRRYNNEWFGVLLMSILESEVVNGRQ